MKLMEVQERMSRGAIVLVGEYLGSKVETQSFLDKVTGRKQECQFANHLLLLKGGPEVVRIVERFEASEVVTPIAQRGQMLVVFGATVERKHGATICRANRKEIHLLES